MEHILRMKIDAQKKLDEARAMHEAVKEENRSMTDEERGTFDRLLRSADKISEEADEMEKRAEAAAEVKKGSVAKSATSGDYRSMFGTPQKDSSFETLNDFMERVAVRDPSLRSYQVGSGADGGFAVPQEWTMRLLDESLEKEIVRRKAKNFPMQHKLLNIPAWDGLDRSDGDSHGGLNAEWLGELAPATRQYGKMRTIQLESHKLAIYTAASREVLEDSINFEKQLVDSLRENIAFSLDKAFLVGDSTNKPSGILNSDSRIVINREEAAQVSYADLVNMYSALWRHNAGISQRPIWICSHEVLPQLMTMQDGNGNLLWQPSAREGIPGGIFGYDLIPTEKTGIPLGDEGDLALVNINAGYAIGVRGDVILDSTQSEQWLTDQVDFRMILRIDGRSTWHEPITVESGKEMSWCVSLGDPN